MSAPGGSARQGFARSLRSPRVARVAAVLAATFAFTATVGIMFGLAAIFTPGSVSFPPNSAMEWLEPARVDFGADYVAHVIPIAFIVFGMAMLFPQLAARPTRTLFATLVISGVWHVIGFNWYLPPHGVLTDGVDDVLIVSSVFVAALHCGIAVFTRGLTRVRSIASACAIGALLIETMMLHALIILPSAQVYDQQGLWLKAAVGRSDVEPAALCRENGLVCLTHEDSRFALLQDFRDPRMPDVVIDRAIEAVDKYGLFQRPTPSEPRTWTLRHRSFDNYTGALRMPAVEFMHDGRRIVVVDMSFAPIANLWIRSYTHLHMLPLCFVWSAMLILITAIHGRERRKS